MINQVIDIIFISILLGVTLNIIRYIGYTGDEVKDIDVKGRTLIIIPVKNPPDSLSLLIKQLTMYLTDSDIFIAYQGEKPNIVYNDLDGDVNINIIKGVETPEYIGKIGNIVTILKSVDITKYKYIIFLDDDIYIHPRWFNTLKNLSEYTGFATGYRVYIPMKSGLGSVMVSVWNLYSLDTIYNSKERIVWGGSACLRIDKVDINMMLRLWRRGISDDVPLTYLARSMGGIGFNELTLVPSPSYHGLKDALEFIIRQQRIVYVYNKSLWLKGILIHLILNLLMAIAIVDMLNIYLYGIDILRIMKILMVATLFSSYIFRNHVRLGRYEDIFGEKYRVNIRRLKIYNILFTPAILLIQLYLLIASRGYKIKWRGRIYTLPTPDELGYTILTKTS